MSVTVIEGGTGSNVIPAACAMTASRRLIPGEDAQIVYEQLSELARSSCPLPTSIE